MREKRDTNNKTVADTSINYLCVDYVVTWANTGVAAVRKWNRIMSWSMNIISRCLSLQKHFASIPIQCLRHCQFHFSDVIVKSIQVRSLILLRSETSSNMSDQHFSWHEFGHVLSILNSGNVSDYRRSRIAYICIRIDFYAKATHCYFFKWNLTTRFYNRSTSIWPVSMKYNCVLGIYRWLRRSIRYLLICERNPV